MTRALIDLAVAKEFLVHFFSDTQTDNLDFDRFTAISH